MNCRQMKELYESGKLEKREYAQMIFAKHENLLEYQELVKDSDSVRAVAIEKDGVVVSIENRDCGGGKYTIDMFVFEKDFSAVPVQMLNFGSYEREELEMVMKICNQLSKSAKDHVAFFDIGANLGWYSLNVCKQFENVFSYAFEPMDETCKRMKKNVIRNGISNCNIYQLGLSNKTEKKIFFFDMQESGASSLTNIRENPLAVETECDFMQLDEFVEKNRISHMDFIKCDVEGAELFVYQGGIKSIEKFKPIVFSEMLRCWSAKFGYHPNDIIDLFHGIGYQCYVLDDSGRLKEFGRVTEDTIETNYFFLHEKEHTRLVKELCLA